MANSSFSFTNYGEIAVIDVLNGGISLYGNGYNGPTYENLPVVGTKVVAVSPAQVLGTKFGSVTVNSIIEVYPSGLVLPAKPRRFISDAAFSVLVTART